MIITRQSLFEHFQLLNDDELLAQFRSGELTDLAKSVADEELQRRGIVPAQETVVPPVADEDTPEAESLVPVARFFSPIEGEILKSRLEAEGVPAIVADAQTVQTIPLMAIAVGGVRVLVPESYTDRALEIIKRVEKGDYVFGNDTGA
jgi:hypothetical protein